MREHGTMKAAMIVGSDDGNEAVRLAREQPEIGGLDLIGRVTCKKAYNVKGQKDGDNIVVMDLG